MSKELREKEPPVSDETGGLVSLLRRFGGRDGRCNRRG